jgi:hypothetical protein
LCLKISVLMLAKKPVQVRCRQNSKKHFGANFKLYAANSIILTRLFSIAAQSKRG